MSKESYEYEIDLDDDEYYKTSNNEAETEPVKAPVLDKSSSDSVKSSKDVKQTSSSTNSVTSSSPKPSTIKNQTVSPGATAQGFASSTQQAPYFQHQSHFTFTQSFKPTHALYLQTFPWWSTEEDIRNQLVSINLEGQLKLIIFDDHKINGKSKGQIYLEFTTLQACIQAKQHFENRVKGDNGLPLAVVFVNTTPMPFKPITQKNHNQHSNSTPKSYRNNYSNNNSNASQNNSYNTGYPSQTNNSNPMAAASMGFGFPFYQNYYGQANMTGQQQQGWMNYNQHQQSPEFNSNNKRARYE